MIVTKSKFMQDAFIKDLLQFKAALSIEKRKTISTHYMAKKTGLSAMTFTRIFRGETEPTLDTITRICGWIKQPVNRYFKK